MLISVLLIVIQPEGYLDRARGPALMLEIFMHLLIWHILTGLSCAWQIQYLTGYSLGRVTAVWTRKCIVIGPESSLCWIPVSAGFQSCDNHRGSQKLRDLICAGGTSILLPGLVQYSWERKRLEAAMPGRSAALGVHAHTAEAPAEAGACGSWPLGLGPWLCLL